MTHAALPVIAAMAVGRGRSSRGLVIACAVAAVIPDLDVAGRAFGISSESLLGHRGISHSIAAAALIAIFGGALLAGRYRWQVSLPCLFLSALSHGLTDMLTDGGKGIALWWPISDERLFAPFRPIEVSPILLRGFENGKLPLVLLSELIWLIAPALLVALLVRILVPPHIDLDKGQS
nr:metal-dependent hydrolase [Sphingomonas caseinilyticus]